MSIKVGSTDVQEIYVGSTPVQEVYVGSTKVWPNNPVYTTITTGVVAGALHISSGYIIAATWVDSSGTTQTTQTTFNCSSQDLVTSSADAGQSGKIYLCSDGTCRAEWASTAAGFDRVALGTLVVDSQGSISSWTDEQSQVVPQ